MNKTLATLIAALALGACGTESTTPSAVDADKDGYDVATDCDDANAAVHPGAAETCNGADDDCDGSEDEGLLVTYYADADADGHGASASTVTSCSGVPSGAVANADDCDDARADIHPGATETCTATEDLNCDGSFGDVDADQDGVIACLDCNDAAMDVHPGATEVCDASDVDEDCDGTADDADASATGKASYYFDGDEDGYGSATSATFCDPPVDHVANSDDCDDGVTAIHPGATEVCDASDVDEDCDGSADDADASATGKATYYLDGDSDGYAGSTSADYCDAPALYLATSTDCNDSAMDVHPGATEVCDASDLDEDCDGAADDADASATSKSTFYLDGDNDGFGGTTTASYCDAPANYVATSTDCDDAALGVNPGTAEVCDANDVDEDCDGTADDADANATQKTTYYFDGDNDGYAGSTSAAYCDAPANYLASSADCDDTDDAIHPGVTETCDGVDQDCDGTIDFGRTVPTDYATIQDAIDVSVDGDHLCVLAGTHSASFWVEGKNLTIEGENRDGVILDAAAMNQYAHLRDTTTTLKNVTITSSLAAIGDRVVWIVGGAPVLENVAITGVHMVHPDWCGGVVSIDSSEATLRDVVMHDNSLTCGHASGGVVTINNGNLTSTFERVSITDNTFMVGVVHRGSVFLYNAGLTAKNLVIANNSVDATNPNTGHYSFGIGAEGNVPLDLENVTVVGNSASANMAPAYYGALHGSVVRVRNLIAASNKSANASTYRLISAPADADIAYVADYDSDPYLDTTWGAFGDPSGVVGLVSVDPAFIDTTGASATTWNLDLAATSALVDTGDPAILDVDGTQSDYGAYGGPGATW